MTDIASQDAGLSMRPFESGRDLAALGNDADLLTLPFSEGQRYIVGFAASRRCVERAQRLRYEVFNLELEEGLAESIETGLDADRFDDTMDHLILVEASSGRVVGTYRLQTVRKALETGGIYSAQEYELDPLRPYFGESVELGRACLAVEHRTFRAMVGMWLGIGAYMNAFDQRYLFGCCSLTSTDPVDGWRALRTIREQDLLHESLFVQPKPAYDCGPELREVEAIPLPKLFRTYMRLGAKVMSGPALDREFGTVDFLVLLDGKQIALSRLDVLK